MWEYLCRLYLVLNAGFALLAFILNLRPLGWGRLAESISRVQVSPRLGWFIMEVPSLLWALYALSSRREVDLLLLFALHYLNRSVIYPLRMTSTRKMPVEIVAMALLFNLANGYLQSMAYLRAYPSGPLQRVAGVAIFLLGMYINIDSDERLRVLRGNSGGKYLVPRGGMFQYVSSANYFGEIVEWLGYWLACGEINSMTFGLFTLVMLGTEGIKRAQFNESKIEGYPKGRARVFPFVL